METSVHESLAGSLEKCKPSGIGHAKLGGSELKQVPHKR